MLGLPVKLNLRIVKFSSLWYVYVYVSIFIFDSRKIAKVSAKSRKILGNAIFLGGLESHRREN